MHDVTRRRFLAGGAAVGAASLASSALLGACSSDDGATRAASSGTGLEVGLDGLPKDPSKAPFDTVVVLMMENRSLDHLLGWLPGANGTQEGLTFADKAGRAQKTWSIAPDWQGCDLDDPQHQWQACATQFNDGRCDGFLQTQKVGDLFPVSFYREQDLPVLAALAKGYTAFDAYFCSLLAGTWPNRLYQHCAATDIDATGIYPDLDNAGPVPTMTKPRPSKLQLAIWDRIAEKGITGGYYSHDEPMTGLFASGKYDHISHSYEQFLTDARAGTLPNVAFVDPDYGLKAELTGTSNDMHPHGSVKVGDAFLAEVHEALRTSPQWSRMVFVLNFDEHGGFYDTVRPPKVRDDNVNPNPGPHPDYGNLGFRVPAIAMGPFAPQKVEKDGPYEHCSVLRMIEWRWGLEPMTARDRYARNLALALDLTHRREPVELPAYDKVPKVACPTGSTGAP
jgi:phospholipase C